MWFDKWQILAIRILSHSLEAQTDVGSLQCVLVLDLSRAEEMVHPESWIQFGQQLQLEPGVVNYSVKIGKLELRAECRYVQDGKKLQRTVTARLHSNKQHLELPLPTCLELFSGFNDYFSMEEKYLSQK